MANNKEFKVTVMVKSSSTNAFLAGGKNWYNLTKKQVEGKDEVYKVYEKLNKGDKVSGTYYEFKGKKYIDTLKVDEVAPKQEEEKPKEETFDAPETESKVVKDVPKCKKCGKELKDDKYDTCYNCNQNTKKKDKTEVVRKEDPEKQDQIARGNAVNAIAAILASSKDDKEFKSKMTMLYAEVDKLQDYIRNGR